MAKLMLILADQLYQELPFKQDEKVDFVMIESLDLCQRLPYHKYKLAYLLTCLRHYKQHLQVTYPKANIHYFSLEANQEFTTVLTQLAPNYDTICHFQIDDKTFSNQLSDVLKELKLPTQTLPSPKFLLSPQDQSLYYTKFKPKRTLMNDFYIFQRKRLGILMDPQDMPVGGKWSFDEQNRKKLPKSITPPKPSQTYPSPEFSSVKKLIESHFPNNVGNIFKASWLPTTHLQAQQWLDEFLQDKLQLFGDYEDALTTRSTVVFHSAISPLLNNGLLTPNQVLQTLDKYLQTSLGFSIFRTQYTVIQNPSLPTFLNSIEGFVRQIIGWREWIKLMYDKEYTTDLASYNFFAATKPLPQYFWQLDASHPELKDNYPLQNVLAKINDYSWSHHIERLMILSNWMVLNEYDPIECLHWFQAMFVDAFDWVMVPNVLGMGLFADGGIFATKPYIAGGNYLKKMSDYPDSKIWEAVWTDKFWQFLIKHQEYFKTNPRMNMLIQGRLNKKT